MPRPRAAPTCSAPDCARPARTHGLCEGHDRQQRRHPGRPLVPLRGRAGMLGDEPLEQVTVGLPPDIVAAMRATGAASLSAALRLIVEAWWRSRER